MVQEIDADPLASFWGEMKCALVRPPYQCRSTRRDPTALQHMSCHECNRLIQAGGHHFHAWISRAGTSLAGAGRILAIFSSEQVGFLRFECLQIG